MDISAKNVSTLGVEADYCVKDAFIHGNNKARALDSMLVSHPLQSVLSKHAKKQEEVDVKMLVKLQGLHAPLRLNLEKRAVRDVGHLPCLHRHNALMDALTGNDTMIDFDDFLNDPRDAEVMGQPHMMIERHLKML